MVSFGTLTFPQQMNVMVDSLAKDMLVQKFAIVLHLGK